MPRTRRGATHEASWPQTGCPLSVPCEHGRKRWGRQRGGSREGVLRHDADLLRQRRPAHRPRVHDGRRRRPDPLAPAARREVHFLTGTDEHGEKILRAAEANGMTPQQWCDHMVESAWKPMLAAIDAANDDFIRTTEARHTGPGSGVPARCCTTVARSTRAPTPARTASRARSSSCPASSSQPGDRCPVHDRPVEQLSEENYFFRLSRLPGQAAGALPRPPAVRAARVGAQRGRPVRRERAAGPVAVPVDLRLGRERALGLQPRRLRLDRRAAELHHGRRLGQRPGSASPGCGRRTCTSSARTSCASTRSSGRRCCMAAGLALPTDGLRQRLAARRRREDEQDQADGHPAAAHHRPLRLGRLPLLLPARAVVRPGRVVQLGVDGPAVHQRARQRFRQPRLPADEHGRALPRTGRCRPRPPSRLLAEALEKTVAARRRAGVRAGLPGRARGGVRLRAAGQRVRDRLGAVGARERPCPRGRPRPRALRHRREPAGAGRAAQPGDAQGVREAVDVARRGSRARPARRRSASRTPGGGASCPAGSQVRKSEVLFPRLPDEEPAP